MQFSVLDTCVPTYRLVASRWFKIRGKTSGEMFIHSTLVCVSLFCCFMLIFKTVLSN